jgi:hypothetical protein
MEMELRSEAMRALTTPDHLLLKLQTQLTQEVEEGPRRGAEEEDGIR